jgi:hypothetical protein
MTHSQIRGKPNPAASTERRGQTEPDGARQREKHRNRGYFG